MEPSRNDSAFMSLIVAGIVAVGCEGGPPPASADRSADAVAVRGEASIQRPPYTWSGDDAQLLDQVQRGAFNFFWNNAHPATGLTPDRTGVSFASVAGVGFELAAFPIGIERGWISRAEGEHRTLQILRALSTASGNRHDGMFFHFLDSSSALPDPDGYEVTASTIDSALLFSGMIVASSYFGGEISQLADAMIEEADWASYAVHDQKEEFYCGFISLGWKAKDPQLPGGDGSLLPFYWADAGDEQRLVTFLAAGNQDRSRAVDPKVYYSLRRRVGEYGDGPMVWFPWSGALFTSFFAHCWIDYAHMTADDPSAHGVERRPPVDWWENSRRVVLMHRKKAIENPLKLAGFSENAWGLSACDGPTGYLVPGLFPRSVKVPLARPDFDFAAHDAKDDWADGTIAPYAAGCAIMFTPTQSIEALRHYRALKNAAGDPLVWRDPSAGGMGFLDSFNPKSDWHAPGCVAIDQGPLILAIENARTGLIWDLFQRHPFVRRASERLGFRK